MAYIRYDDQAGEYFEYILDRVGMPKWFRRRYSKLLDYLFETPFTWIINNDVNREMDGLELREEYFDEIGIDNEDRDSELDEHRCSVLEMMIALAERIEYHIMGEPGDDDPSRWVIEMVENLGLDAFDDEAFDENDVDYIVQKWLHRAFDRDGNGSIFPVKKQGKNEGKNGSDMRRAEIWFQMCKYLEEKYPILG